MTYGKFCAVCNRIIRLHPRHGTDTRGTVIPVHSRDYRLTVMKPKCTEGIGRSFGRAGQGTEEVTIKPATCIRTMFFCLNVCSCLCICLPIPTVMS
jgi:hypothetical protein